MNIKMIQQKFQEKIVLLKVKYQKMMNILKLKILMKV